VSGEVFADHFAQLFGKESEEQLLHLNVQSVSRALAERRKDLAGPPTVGEVQRAIAGLNLGKAPGSNGQLFQKIRFFRDFAIFSGKKSVFWE
jgi:hypothetical protein